MSALGIAVGFVALQRLAELVHARRNTRRLFERGAVEIGARHYPLIVALHSAWLVALPATLPWNAPVVHPVLLALYVLVQPLRYWTMASLGSRWTTRIIVLSGAPPVRRGPYRWIAHPNYLIVAAEIALLPLAFGAVALAAIFSVANAALLFHRVRLENAAFRARAEIVYSGYCASREAPIAPPVRGDRP